MKSITLLLYSPIDGVIKVRILSIDIDFSHEIGYFFCFKSLTFFQEVARDYHTNWMTACEMFDTEIFIGAENSNNFFTLKKNSEAILQEDRQRLELTGEYHFGEFVNRFRAGSLVMKSLEGEGLNISTLICCSVSGVIGLVGQITEEQYNFLIQVQGELNKVIFLYFIEFSSILSKKSFFFNISYFQGYQRSGRIQPSRMAIVY